MSADVNDFGIDMRHVVVGARVLLDSAISAPVQATVHRMDLPRLGVVRLDSGELALFHSLNVIGILIYACTCPDIDVTQPWERPGTVTVKGLDENCPLHGPHIPGTEMRETPAAEA